MDISDQATLREEQERERSLAETKRNCIQLDATGACHYCGEDVDAERRLCDSDCRDMWQRQESARKRAGA